MSEQPIAIEALARDVRLYLFCGAAATGHIPQAPEIGRALGRPESEIRTALRALAAAKVLILAPNDGQIWAANPFVERRRTSRRPPVILLV